HTIHGFSKSWLLPAVAIATGDVQPRPPFVERLAMTAAPFGPGTRRPSEAAIQTLCRASNATDASVARSYGPAGFWYRVIAGRTPLVQETALLVVVAKPIPEAPSSLNWPIWATATIVESAEYVSGSTTVLCWL